MLERFLGTIYAHVDNLDRLLDGYLSTVTELMPAPSFAVYLLDTETGGAQRVASRGVGDAFLTQYERKGRATDPLLQHLVRRLEPIHDRGLFRETTWMSHPMHQVLRLHRLTRVLEAPIVVSGSLVGTLNFARTDDDPPFTEDDLAVVDRLAGHTAAALARAEQFSDLRSRRDMAEAVLEASRAAVLVMTAAGSLQYANSSGKQLLEHCRHDAVLDSRLREGLLANTRHVHTRMPEASCVIGLPAMTLGRERYLTVRSVLMAEAGGEPASSVISFVYRAGDSPSFAHLTRLLSAREIEVLELLAHGLDNQLIAHQLTVSVNTVKAHLKRISVKLGANCRAQILSRAFFSDGAPS